ncbi:sulfite exporter TauE/SafE family protein [Flavobacterium sp. ASW18X]|uniref:sulfite exporter TauE/SafE family protein n=1 Tax=Flavobacterium sp. ASW18X TaxID=2572595 RepID=UPI0010ADE01B|nr:sulfite exporter TauE/SafE family protein [Flavobacterium sp. ASW18X]TKD66063.1 sulfite exporter TauE/SafE family protein [Flavobacterium sp. ASW18X]
MMWQQPDFIALCIGFFFIALLYSSVGFGGGSSYLALLTLVVTSFFAIRSIALLCNLTVVTSSCWLYYKKGHFHLKKFLPFIITSIPFAFLGASFRLKEVVFFGILGIALISSAVALAYQTLKKQAKFEPKTYPKSFLYFMGAGIGLLSGLVGIGGGIFLAPVLNQLKWDKPIIIAALASFFIWVNSIAGLVGLISAGTLKVIWPEIMLLLVAVFLGGQLGVRISLGKFTAKAIRLLTALLVLFVGLRVFLINGLNLNLFS